MKNVSFSISLLFCVGITLLFGQIPEWWAYFDSPYFFQEYSSRFEVDTVNYPNNKWQIGHPNKSVFDTALSAPNALVTDTVNTLPPNDTSVVYIKHIRSAPKYGVFALHFKYQMDGDSTDKGIVEISPDTGNTWINLLQQDTTYDMSWGGSKPSLRGSTNGWQSFDAGMTAWADAMKSYPVYLTADTILFRFTYITESNSTGRDGWIIDNMYFEDWWFGIEEVRNDDLMEISPNPVSGELRVHRSQKYKEGEIQIFNSNGKMVHRKSNFTAQTIDVSQLPNGIYYLKYGAKESYAVRKFVLQH